MTRALVFSAAFTALAAAGAAAADSKGGPVAADSFYSLKTTTLQGQPADLGQYAGQVTLVVNTASQCGYTPQYAGLEKLHGELQGRGFSVLGFPSNDFGGQEPGSEADISAFCKKNYGVTFDMFSKVTVKGDSKCDLYKLLTTTDAPPAVVPGEVGWNFEKFLISRDGKVVGRFKTGVAPDAEALVKAIETELAKK